jgi:hypothetical protein
MLHQNHNNHTHQLAAADLLEWLECQYLLVGNPDYKENQVEFSLLHAEKSIKISIQQKSSRDKFT